MSLSILMQLASLDDRVMGERAETADGEAQILAAGVMTAGAVRQLHSGGGDAAEVAQVGVAGGAARAPTARRHEAEHDVIADLQRGRRPRRLP